MRFAPMDSDFDDDLDSQLGHFGARPVSSDRRVQHDLFGNSLQQYQPVEKPQKSQKPTHHEIDYDALQTYIYPINYEVRDYQFNIIEKAFYHNILVALPTGLGKTFIAATIILNYFRWFPASKIIFMAPTRPLVAQQIKACFNIVGLKHEFAILLDKSKRNRLEIWQNNRIFFTTPQVVENDLASGLVSPKSISLLVVDEAHKAKGNYAYNNVVKFVDRFNQSYRILALTATPSSTVEGVKEIVQNLSVTKIEIRTENSIDIIKYFKHKKIDKLDISFEANDLIGKFLACVSAAAEDAVKLAKERGIVAVSDPLYLNSFQLLEASRKNTANTSLNDGLKWSNHYLIKLLIFISNGLKKLKIYGLKNFVKYFSESFRSFKSKKSTNRILINFYEDPNVLQMMDMIMSLNLDQVSSHPKIEAMIDYLKEFFSQEKFKDSKVIVFSEFRESALEIVNSIDALKNPMLKPHIFIGQAAEANPIASDKPRTSSEDAKLKGMNQKTQKKIIKEFKSGVYNILVATSIGEEGLDIGEVDLIICYDSTSSPIKNVQRLGRTGRKRDGNILMLFADNERKKFDKAMDNYEYIQGFIMKNEKDLVQDSPLRRIVPKDYKPQLVKKYIEIENEIQNDDEDEIIKLATQYMNSRGGKKKAKASKSRKPEKIQKQFFMPDEVETGFQNVSTMVRKNGHEKSVAEEKQEELNSSQEMDLIDVSTLSNDKENLVIKHAKAPPPKKPASRAPSFAPSESTRAPSVVDMLKNTKKTLGTRRPVKRRKVEEPETSTQKSVVQEAPDLTGDYDISAVLAAVADVDSTNLSSTQPLPETQTKEVSVSGTAVAMASDSDFSDFDDGLDNQLLNIKSSFSGSPELEVKVEVKAEVEPESPANAQIKVKPEPPETREPTQVQSAQVQPAQAETDEISDSEGNYPELDSEPLASNRFDANEGFLNSQEKLDLYTNYYAPGSSTEDFYEPQSFRSGVIGHSKKTQALKDCVTSSISLDEAKRIIGAYTAPRNE